MSGGNSFECTLELVNESHVKYRDTSHLEQVFEEAVDNDELRQATTEWLSESLQERADFGAGRGLRILGRHLYERVFRGEVDRVFRETFREFETQATPDRPGKLRLSLVFHKEAEKLARLPWEFLYFAKPDGKGTFLSGENHVLLLTRVVPEQSKVTDDTRGRALRILLAVCTPRGRNSGTTEELQTLLQRMSDSHQVVLRSLDNPTYSQLEAELKQTDADNRPDVVHFIGHGEPGALVMRREDERIAAARAQADLAASKGAAVPVIAEHETVETSKIEGLFTDYKPSLVFVQACYGAAVLSDDVLYSTALEIVKQGVPAVIAMQYEIEAEEADGFAAEFYTHLIDGHETIGEAVLAGRRKLAKRERTMWSHRDFGTPVVYLDRDTEVVSSREGSSTPKTEGVGTISCPRCGHAMKYRTCPLCKLKLDCPECLKELEIPTSGFCGNCECEFDQKPWPPSEPEIAPARQPEPAAVPLRRADVYGDAVKEKRAS